MNRMQPSLEETKLQNAHERFGSLEFTKRTKETTTRVRVYIDRAVLETTKDERSPDIAHLVSLIGSDGEIGALWAAVTEGALFHIQLPGDTLIAASLGLESQCFRGSVALPGRKRNTSAEALGLKTKRGSDERIAGELNMKQRTLGHCRP